MTTRKEVKHESVRIKKIVLDLHGVHGSDLKIITIIMMIIIIIIIIIII